MNTVIEPVSFRSATNQTVATPGQLMLLKKMLAEGAILYEGSGVGTVIQNMFRPVGRDHRTDFEQLIIYLWFTQVKPSEEYKVTPCRLIRRMWEQAAMFRVEYEIFCMKTAGEIIVYSPTTYLNRNERGDKLEWLPLVEQRKRFVTKEFFLYGLEDFWKNRGVHGKCHPGHSRFR